MIIVNNLLLYGDSSNSKLYIDGVSKTIPTLNGTYNNRNIIKSCYSHTALRGWHHYYIEFNTTIWFFSITLLYGGTVTV